jgi:hypothetical protein
LHENTKDKVLYPDIPSLAAAQEKYEAAIKAVALALPESEIRKNEAKVWCYYGVAAGAVLAGTGILLGALKR